MPSAEFPKRHLAALLEVAARALDSRQHSDNKTIARDMLAGFFDVCRRYGLDRVLFELAQTYPELDASDRQGLFEHASVGPAFVTAVGALELGGGGPRNAKPGQLVDCVVATLGLTVTEDDVQATPLGDDARAAVAAALASVIDVELAAPRHREAVIAKARASCEPRYLGAFDRIAAQLDERGVHVAKMPKVPIDAVQAVQQLLIDARQGILDAAGRAAIDRARDVLARVAPEVAARIDQPVSHELTPRDVAILRASDARVPRQPAAVVQAMLDGLGDVLRIAWLAAERPVRTYAASQTFEVGDLVDHPKFGRGSVTAVMTQRVDIEFADGNHTLVHAGKRG
jgi:hypothetical protein